MQKILNIKTKDFLDKDNQKALLEKNTDLYFKIKKHYNEYLQASQNIKKKEKEEKYNVLLGNINARDLNDLIDFSLKTGFTKQFLEFLKINTDHILKNDRGLEIKELNYKLYQYFNGNKLVLEDKYFWQVLERNFGYFSYNFLISFLIKGFKGLQSKIIKEKYNIEKINFLALNYRNYLNSNSIFRGINFPKADRLRFWKVVKEILISNAI